MRCVHPGLHQTWHPACPHQGHTGDSCTSKVEACGMHTMRTCATQESDATKLSTIRHFVQRQLLAQDLASSPTTPRAHWRQQPIKDRALFHVYDLQCRKATLRGWRRAKLCNQAISLHKTWSPACPHQEHTGDSSPSKYVLPQRDPTMQQCDSSCDSCDSATVRQCDSFATVRQFCDSATVATV